MKIFPLDRQAGRFYCVDGRHDGYRRCQWIVPLDVRLASGGWGAVRPFNVTGKTKENTLVFRPPTLLKLFDHTPSFTTCGWYWNLWRPSSGFDPQRRLLHRFPFTNIHSSKILWFTVSWYSTEGLRWSSDEWNIILPDYSRATSDFAVIR